MAGDLRRYSSIMWIGTMPPLIMPIGRMPWVTMPMRSTCTPNWLTAKEHLQDNLRTFSPLVPLDGEGREFLDNVAERMIDSQKLQKAVDQRDRVSDFVRYF